jgi:hypothetical protein
MRNCSIPLKTMNNQMYVSTLSGTFLSMVPNLNSEDLLKTALLAVLGTLVSFSLSVLLHWLFKKPRK